MRSFARAIRALPILAAVMILALGGAGRAEAAMAELAIMTAPKPSTLETLAAREVARYFYLRTGALPALTVADKAPAGDTIVIARKGRPMVSRVAAIKRAAANLGAGQYLLKTQKAKGHRTVWIVGGDDVGTLYGAYRFAEALGVRFYLHGDVIPDGKIAAELPTVNETGKPLFSIRGIQPFHDFPEGPDWWDRDDYLAYIGQLPKMRMNFIGLHCYPEGNVGPEPGVWIGRPGEMDARGRVRASYPAQWANTARPKMWGYAAMDTSDFRAGAAQLFAEDDFGPAVHAGMMPRPSGTAQSNRLFNRTGEMLRDAFAEARVLGVKTCVGTETPLTVPKEVQARIRAAGKDPQDLAVVRELYKGIFSRIARMDPVDYYWLWTPENWTWQGNKPEQYQKTVADINAALGALKDLGNPFTLATCGWVLGPQHDRAALDKLLPKNVPMSCINRDVGHSAVEPGFAKVAGRPKWAIPWMENDPNLTAPQPWVGRMRADAATALRYGCTGLLGIHWRTKALAPNVAALADAAWDQSWVPADFKPKPAGVERPATPSSAATPQRLPGGSDRSRTMPVKEFYADFARASFGPKVGTAAGDILARIDGTNLPDPGTWLGGPGGVKPNPEPWGKVRRQYRFVEALAALRPGVKSAGDLERFDYWLDTYRAMAAFAEAGCRRGELDKTMAELKKEKDPAKRKALAARGLKARLALARAWERMLTCQVQATDTPGELGTLANLEQHNRGQMKFIELYDAELTRALGRPLPEAAKVAADYTGRARIIVPTVRTLARPGEALTLKAIVPAAGRPARGEVYWRPLGRGEFKTVALERLGRAVYQATLPAPPAGTLGIEYYVKARTEEGTRLWPVTAPERCQTVIVGPGY